MERITKPAGPDSFASRHYLLLKAHADFSFDCCIPKFFSFQPMPDATS
jgi:hypothetical protein